MTLDEQKFLEALFEAGADAVYEDPSVLALACGIGLRALAKVQRLEQECKNLRRGP